MTGLLLSLSGQMSSKVSKKQDKIKSELLHQKTGKPNQEKVPYAVGLLHKNIIISFIPDAFSLNETSRTETECCTSQYIKLLEIMCFVLMSVIWTTLFDRALCRAAEVIPHQIKAEKFSVTSAFKKGVCMHMMLRGHLWQKWATTTFLIIHCQWSGKQELAWLSYSTQITSKPYPDGSFPVCIYGYCRPGTGN